MVTGRAGNISLSQRFIRGRGWNGNNYTAKAVYEYEEAKARLEVILMLPPRQVDRLIQLKEE